MKLKCPHCKSSSIRTLNYGRKLGGTIGTIAGAASNVTALIGGAKTGLFLGAIVGGLQTGSLANAFIRALQGGIAGCAIGITLGNMIDNDILSNHQYLSCKHRFSIHKTHHLSFPPEHSPYDIEQ